MILQETIKSFYTSANRLSGRRLDIIKECIKEFSRAGGPQAAASMAYYTFFSLFPLLLLLVSTGSLFLESRQAYQQALGFIKQAVPVSNSLIEQNLQRVLNARGAVSLVSIAVLIWSASSVFSGLAFNINRAWTKSPKRSFVQKRLVAFGMVASLVVLLIISLLTETAFHLLSSLQVPLLGSVTLYNMQIWSLASTLAPWFSIFLLFFALFRWVPTTEVKLIPALCAAAAAATGWKLATSLFVWYLGSGLGRYEIIYGSLGTVVALLFLIYLINWITLFCAHLSAAIQEWMEQHR